MYIFQVKITPSVAKHLIQMYNFLKPRLTANAGPNDMYYIGEWVIFYYFIMKKFLISTGFELTTSDFEG